MSRKNRSRLDKKQKRKDRRKTKRNLRRMEQRGKKNNREGTVAVAGTSSSTNNVVSTNHIQSEVNNSASDMNVSCVLVFNLK